MYVALKPIFCLVRSDLNFTNSSFPMDVNCPGVFSPQKVPICASSSSSVAPFLMKRLSYLHSVCSSIYNIFKRGFGSNFRFIQGCRIPGSGGAQAPPVFRTLSHNNAIKPKNLHFFGVWAPPDCSRHPHFSGWTVNIF